MAFASMNAILFLPLGRTLVASDEVTYMTGAELMADGRRLRSAADPHLVPPCIARNVDLRYSAKPQAYSRLTIRPDLRSGMFTCRLADLRQVDWRGRVSSFAEASAPGGSRNGSTEMRS